MPVKPLSPNIRIEDLEREARNLLDEHAAKAPTAAQRLREFHPALRHSSDAEIFGAAFSLADAQLAIARERGFSEWSRLQRHFEHPSLAGRLDLPHHERIEDPSFRRAVDLLDQGDVPGLRALLANEPDLVHRRVLLEGGNYFRNPSLLEFIAENPVRHGTLPANIVDVAKVILEAGPDNDSRNEALMLVATGSVPRECQVQAPLLETLCASGADPNSALHAAALHGELGSLQTLLRLGGIMDLPILAALGLSAEFERLLPQSNPEERHLAFALAAQYGHIEIVRALLAAGENPNCYNPPGGHAHSTPLHEAAGQGHIDLVRLLVEHGARLNIRDVLWHATPADWARHAGQTETEAYLREHELLRP